MNIGLVIGKANSTGVPGKNLRRILGRPAAEYAFIAARGAQLDRVYVSTDSQDIKEIGIRYSAQVIDRPGPLATSDALTEDVLAHAYQHIVNDVDQETDIETISLLFCNNPAIDAPLMKRSINDLANDADYDSCFSVARYDMFSPVRARRLVSGEIKPFVDLSHFENVSSIRDSSGGAYFCTLAIQVMKPICFTNMDSGQEPFRWQGNRSKAIVTDFGFDIDADWQFVVMEYWLRQNGFSEDFTPW